MAVAETFEDAWVDKAPKESRLVHGAGIVSMGYVMNYLHASNGSITKEDFKIGLAPLRGKTA